MLGRVLSLFGIGRAGGAGTRPAALLAAAGRRRVRAGYDAAKTDHLNKRHWAAADGLSVNAGQSPGVRKVLRDRCRHEAANSSFVKGCVLTLANDVVGTSPRAQVLTSDSAANRLIERLYGEWFKAINGAQKVRTMRIEKCQAGESFAAAITNEALPTPVKLDYRLYEADQIETPDLGITMTGEVSGIERDEHGNTKAFHVLKAHPGDFTLLGATEYDVIPASRMVHLFRAERPGQARGIPELTPALPYCAILRRYNLAVLHSAENAAKIAQVLYTDNLPDPDDDEIDAPEALETVELEANTATVLPAGYKLESFKPAQPTTTHGEYERAVKREICRCINMPLNIALGDSSRFNYASGRLDHQTYHRFIRVDRSELEAQVLDRWFAAWWAELLLISELWGGGENHLPLSLRRGPTPTIRWMYDGAEHVDPAKEASAQDTNLRNGSESLANACAKRGLDWEEHLDQLQREEDGRRRRGLPSIFVATATKSITENAGPDERPAESDSPATDQADLEVVDE